MWVRVPPGAPDLNVMSYCTSCGLPIPEGQGNNSCSMCYGDIGHGKDGYYQQWAEEQVRQEAEDEIIGCLVCGNPNIGDGRYCLECLKTMATTDDF